MRVRGLVAGPFADRPGRPPRERQLVREAAALVSNELAAGEVRSAVALARIVAERVLDRVEADFDLPPSDVVAVTGRLQAVLSSGDPIVELACCDEIDTGALIAAERRARLEARRYRRLSPAEQQREDGEIREAALVTLSERYRKNLGPLS